MIADTAIAPSIWEKFAAPDRCWCCKRPFDDNGVAPMAAHRDWLAFQFAPYPPPSGICEQCATERDACPRCGRVPGLAGDGNPFLQTWALQDGDSGGFLGDDGDRLKAADLEELAVYCETCVVRDHLMSGEVSNADSSAEVVFDLIVIVARHWARSLNVGQQGLPVPEDEVERVEQLSWIICTTLICSPKTLEYVVANEARDPTFRRALEMLAERCIERGQPMPQLLQEWVQHRDANELPKQVSNRPVEGHATLLIAVILTFIDNLPWVSESGITTTRSRGTASNEGRSVCDAVARGLREYCYRFEVARGRVEKALESLRRSNPNADEALFQLVHAKRHLNKAPYLVKGTMSGLDDAVSCLKTNPDGGEPKGIDVAIAVLKEVDNRLVSNRRVMRTYLSVEKISERRTRDIRSQETDALVSNGTPSRPITWE